MAEPSARWFNGPPLRAGGSGQPPPASTRSAGSALWRLLLVRQGEHATLAYLFGYFLLVGAGLAIGRGSADALFFKRYGIEYLPVAFMALAGLLAVVSTLYAAAADRMPAELGYAAIAGPLVLLLLASWWAMVAGGPPWVYPAYYLSYEVASELLLVHGALFIAQNLDTLAAKRLAGLALAGSQLGAMAGGLVLAGLAPRLGVENLLLVWCGLLLAAGALAAAWHRRHPHPPRFRAPRRARRALPEALARLAGALRMSRDQELLRAGALAMFFMVTSFYVLWYGANRVYAATFESEAALAAFFGTLAAVTSLLSLVLQLLVTGRLIERAGVRRVHLIYPVTTLASYAALTAHFGLPSALLTSLGKDVVLPAFRNPARTVIFNILPVQVQGRARGVWVAVVMPAALLTCGAALWALQRLEHRVAFLLPGALLAGAYLHYSRRVNRAYVTTLVADLKRRLVLPSASDYQALREGGEATRRALIERVGGREDALALACAQALAAAFPESAAGPLVARLRRMGCADADRMVRLLGEVPASLHAELLAHAEERGDPHLRATVLEALFGARAAAARPLVPALLRSSHPRLAAVAVRGVLRYGLADLQGAALARWERLLADEPPATLAGLELLAELPRLPQARAGALRACARAALTRLLAQPDEGLAGRALTATAAWAGEAIPEVAAAISRLGAAADPRVRAAAARCLALVAPAAERDRLTLLALADGHRSVRAAATATLATGATGLAEALQGWLVAASRGAPRAQAALLEAAIEAGTPPGTLAEVARARVADAGQLRRALAAIERVAVGGPAAALLRRVLAERVQQTADVALLALQPLEDPGSISAIRAGLASDDPQVLANACEALATLDRQALARALRALVGARVGEAGAGDAGPFGNARQALEWCARREDEWLASCAARALAQATLEAPGA